MEQQSASQSKSPLSLVWSTALLPGPRIPPRTFCLPVLSGFCGALLSFPSSPLCSPLHKHSVNFHCCSWTTMRGSPHRSHTVVAALLLFGRCRAVVHLFLHVCQPQVRSNLDLPFTHKMGTVQVVITSGILDVAAVKRSSRS